MKYSSPHSRRDAERKTRRRDENLAYAHQLKLTLGCQLTGQMLPPDQLEWHHLYDKKAKVCRLARRSNEQFRQELSKCLCVCRSAHRELHAKTKIY